MTEPGLPAPWTCEDEAIILRGGRARWAVSLRAAGLFGDVIDAALLWNQSRIYPGAAVITVDCGESRHTHVIVGRVLRGIYEVIRRQWDLT